MAFRSYGWALALLGLASGAGADEGMWLPNEFPKARFAASYGFTPTPEQLDHLRLSAVRIGRGGTGSFVSADGLILTNQHVALDCVVKLSSADRDLQNNGFVAQDRSQELPCPDTDVWVLESIERVTAAVEKAGATAAEPGARLRAQEAAIAEIERDCNASTGLTCEVVRLFGGAIYDLYRFRRYTDVRLAFVPENAAVQFGGDTDNFDFPRYSFDFALLRAWQDGKPAKVQHFLRMNRHGLEDGEVLLSAGHPGQTLRSYTLAQLEHLRDHTLPPTLAQYLHYRDHLQLYATRGAEAQRVAQRDIYNLENSIKAISGLLSGLLDPERLETKARREQELRSALARDPALAATFGDPWQDVERALVVDSELLWRYRLLENNLAGFPRLLSIARQLVRLAAEKARPDGERLREYHEAGMPALELRLFSKAPIYPDYEEFRLAALLWRIKTQLGPTHPLVLQLLGRRTPEEVAAEAIRGTRLADVAARRELAAGGQAAISSSQDPLIRLALAIDPVARQLRRRYEDEVESVLNSASSRLAQLEFKLAQGERYPDATGS